MALISAGRVGSSAIVLSWWFGFFCTWLYDVLSGTNRVSAVVVTLLIRDLAVGLGAGLYLVQSVLALCLHFVFLLWSFCSASS